MSKTFNDSRPNVPNVLEVKPGNECMTFRARSYSQDVLIFLAPSDAPALMQAIGDCLPPIPDTVRDGSYEAFMVVAMTYLGKAVRALEAEAAEAEAQAKLEAEALELFKAGFPNSVEPPEIQHSMWLAVARRAREINKEDNNA